GVSKLHTALMRRTLFRDFDKVFPGRIVPITKGISPRTWLLESNPSLAELITSRISDGWLRDLDRLKQLAPLAEDDRFRSEFIAVKQSNKRKLAEFIRKTLGIEIAPDSLF